MTPLPRTIFTTDTFNAKDRFGAWQESMGVLFDITATATTLEPAFYATVDCFQFQQLLLAQTKSHAARYTRCEKRLRRDGLDIILIQLFEEGETLFGAKNQTTLGDTGQMIVFDLAQPLANYNSEYTNLTLAFPRELIEARVPEIHRWHGRVIPEDQGTTRLLKSILLSTYAQAHQLDAVDSLPIQNAILELAAAALHSHHLREVDTESAACLIVPQIKRHIIQHLDSPALSVASICRQLGLSRSQLYRHFEPIGGVREFIDQKRLERSYRDVCAPDYQHLSMAEIGYRWGFRHAGTFSRRFRREFGKSPKEVRKETLEQPFARTLNRLRRSPNAAGYEAWLANLSD